MPRSAAVKAYGVWEKEPGSNVWWIRYRIDGVLRREKVGRKSENNGRIRFLTDAEETSLRAIILERFPEHLPELVISLGTGMRVSEPRPRRGFASSLSYRWPR